MYIETSFSRLLKQSNNFLENQEKNYNLTNEEMLFVNKIISSYDLATLNPYRKSEKELNDIINNRNRKILQIFYYLEKLRFVEKLARADDFDYQIEIKQVKLNSLETCEKNIF